MKTKRIFKPIITVKDVFQQTEIIHNKGFKIVKWYIKRNFIFETLIIKYYEQRN